MKRLIYLTHLINKFGPIKGEKTLQKLVYLIQRKCKTHLYNFRWNAFGPVSYSLQHDLTELVALNFIDITWNLEIPSYFANLSSTKISEYWKEKLNNYVLPENIMLEYPKLNKLFSQIQEDPIKMEIVASLDYLKQKNGYQLSQAKENLIANNKYRFNENEISSGLKFLEELK